MHDHKLYLRRKSGPVRSEYSATVAQKKVKTYPLRKYGVSNVKVSFQLSFDHNLFSVQMKIVDCR